MYIAPGGPHLDSIFSALANPTRRGILARLVDGEATVTDLAEPFGMTQPAISQHVRVLEEAGLVARRAVGTRRPCRLAPGGVGIADKWLGILRDALEMNYDRLDVLLSQEQATKSKE